MCWDHKQKYYEQESLWNPDIIVSKTEKELLRKKPFYQQIDNYNDGYDKNSFDSSKILSNLNTMITMGSITSEL